ncbi:MAG: hypothetical protein Q4P15_01885 [Propionibacteriaceae bacterium]|nr:hypothetical protein [Propionibacteriaceae bacterium]
MTRRLVLWGFVVAALALVAWGVSTWVSPSTQCRGVQMTPGDVCTYSSTTDVGTTRTQTYEERVAAARQSAPVVIVLGLAAAGFGIHLALRDNQRQPDTTGQPSSDIGP